MSSPSAAASERMPVIFLSRPIGAAVIESHRTGPLSEMDSSSAVADVWRSLSSQLHSNIPKAVLVISSSWTNRAATVTAGAKTRLYYDYDDRRTARTSYGLKWNRPGAPGLAKRVEEVLNAANIECGTDETRGVDSGAFLPMMMGFEGRGQQAQQEEEVLIAAEDGVLVKRSPRDNENASSPVPSPDSKKKREDVDGNHPQTTNSPTRAANPLSQLPVVQLSIMRNMDAAAHIALGAALKPLRDEGVLIIGAGNITNPLPHLGKAKVGDAPKAFARDFDEWVSGALTGHTGVERNKVMAGWLQAPGARESHVKDKEEGVMPLHVCVGAAGRDRAAELHRGMALGVWSLGAYVFEPVA